MTKEPENQGKTGKQLERLLWVLSAATFLIFFQAYMVAPLIPRLSHVFGVSSRSIGLVVPAYMIPYGVATLFYGLLSDRLGRRPIMFASLLAFVVFTALTATAQSASQMILWRLVTGLGASGVVPLALALMGDLFPYEHRGRPLGWLFGAMAGGAAFGATAGVILQAFVGWRMLFVTMRYTHTNLDSKHAAVAKLEGFGDNLVTACTKMQQPKEGLSPNAVISYNVARR